MRNLTDTEIAKFAARKGVRKIAVENFLGTLDLSIGARGNLRNMWQDARDYSWNSATQAAITAGIKLASK